MSDEELKELLKKIDSKFQELSPLLHKAGRALVKKAKVERGVKLGYSIGCDEAGTNCLILFPIEVEEKTFDDWHEGYKWVEESVKPLFKGLKWLVLDTPYGLLS